MENSWLSIIPPLLVIIGAYVTKRLNVALLLGIFTGALIAAQGSFEKTISISINRFILQLCDTEKLYLYLFLLSIATFISLFSLVGTAHKLAQIIARRVKTVKTIESASLLVSSLLLIDDYLSILTTGFIMLPLAEHYKIARPKLAFFVHSMAGPLVILAPISTWVAALTTYLQEAGVSASLNHGKTIIVSDPWYLYLHTIPYIFYSFLVIGSVVFIIAKNISYGPMASYEKKKSLYTPDLMLDTHQDESFSQVLSTLIIPLSVLILTLISGLLYTGEYYLFGGSRSFIGAIQNSHDLFFVMAIAGTATLLTGLFFARQYISITPKMVYQISHDGFMLMKPAIIMVFLSGTLGYILKNDVNTGKYLSTIFSHGVPTQFLPFMFFIASIIMTIATGSAWATFAVMFAIAIPMLGALVSATTPVALDAVPHVLPVLGAIFSGSVCGDHISPLSETTVMTATATKCDPLIHAYTQFFYILPAIIGTGIGYLVIGILHQQAPWVQFSTALTVSAVTCIVLLVSFNAYHARKKLN